MRIVCPSCNAQYEIDVSLLPDDGREVQCSACGNIWFQQGAVPPKAARPAPAPGHVTETDAAPAGAGPRKNPKDTAPPLEDHTPELPDEADEALEIEEPEIPQPAARQPKPVDEKVLDILRDEAEFEAKQRAREASGLETQPELGLLGTAPWPSKPEATETASAPLRDDARPAQSASSFPDIDDISESLEPIGRGRNKKTEVEVPATSDAKKRSFLSGLMLPVALALILVALYLAAPAIIGAVPATEPALTGYVSTVDGMRGAILNLLEL